MPRQWCFENGSCTSCDAGLLSRLERAGVALVATGLSLDRPVLKAPQRKLLFESTGGVVFDSVTAAVVRAAASEGVRCLTPKIVGHTVGSGLSTFWNQLDRNIAPLSDYLQRLLLLLGPADGQAGAEEPQA